MDTKNCGPAGYELLGLDLLMALNPVTGRSHFSHDGVESLDGLPSSHFSTGGTYNLSANESTLTRESLPVD